MVVVVVDVVVVVVAVAVGFSHPIRFIPSVVLAGKMITLESSF